MSDRVGGHMGRDGYGDKGVGVGVMVMARVMVMVMVMRSFALPPLSPPCLHAMCTEDGAQTVGAKIRVVQRRKTGKKRQQGGSREA